MSSLFLILVIAVNDCLISLCILSIYRVVVDPDLYRELAPRSENPLMMKFRDLSSVSEPLRWLSRAEKETAVVPSSGFRTSPPGFPVEDSFDFQTAGGGGGVVSYSSRGCRRSDLQGYFCGSCRATNV